MAEKLKAFEFGRLRSSRPNHYEQFLDGNIWKLSEEDSSTGTAKLTSMQTRIANMAREANLDFRSNIIEEDGELFLVIQATEKE